MRRITESAANAAAAVAIGLLVMVLAGRVVLLSFSRPALQAHSLLAAADPSPAAPARLVLLVDRDDAAGAARAARRAKDVYPDQPLEVRQIHWPAPRRGRSREAGVAELASMYGYTELPLLLTVSREGQVVRVRSFSTAE